VNEEALAQWGLTHQKQTKLSLETSGTTHLTSKCHIPEDHNPKQTGYSNKNLSHFNADFNVDICITYLLTPRSRVLLEKLTSSQLIKKFPTIYGTQRFITAFTSARYLTLSKVSIQVQGLLCEHFVTRYIFKVRSC